MNTKIKPKKRLIDNTIHNFRTTKIPLKSILRNQNHIQVFNEVASFANEIIQYAYLLARSFVLHQMKNNLPFPIINKDFYYLCMRIVSNPKFKSNTKKPLEITLFHFFKMEILPLLDGFDQSKYTKYSFSAILQLLSTELDTSFKNNIKVHFFSRLKKLVFMLIELDHSYQIVPKKQRYSLKYAILDSLYTGDTSKIPVQFIQLMNEMRLIYLPPILQAEEQLEGETNVIINRKITNEEYIMTYMVATFKIHNKIEQLYDAAKANLDIYNKEHPIPPESNDFLSDIIGKQSKGALKAYHKEQSKHVDDPIYIGRSKLNKLVSKYRLFQPIPLRTGFITSYFHIDTKCLIYLMNFDKLGYNKQYLIDHFGDNPILRRKIWNHIFNLDKRIFYQKGFEFFHTISTDGFGCSIKLNRIGYIYKPMRINTKKNKPEMELSDSDTMPNNTNKDPANVNIPKKKSEKKPKGKKLWHAPYLNSLDGASKKALENRRLIGIDPGKHKLVQLVDQYGKGLSYDAGTRKRDMCGDKYMRTRDKIREKHGLDQLEKGLSRVNSKTLNYDKFKEYIKVFHSVALKVREIYNNIVFKKQRYSSFILGQQSIERFIYRIKDQYGSDAVLLYGNWGRSDQMRGSAPTKGIGLKRALAQSFELYEIDECGTSKYCSYCDKELEHAAPNKRDKLYRVLKCVGCKGHKGEVNIRYIHRDINGARNILKLGLLEIMGLERPFPYRRRAAEKIELPKIKVLTPRKIIKSETEYHEPRIDP
jgi:hypothetical protein